MQNSVMQTNGSPVTEDDLSEITGIKPSKLAAILERASHTHIPYLGGIVDYGNKQKRKNNISRYGDYDENATGISKVTDWLEDEKGDTSKRIQQEISKNNLNRWLKKLSERERTVLEERFGIKGNIPKTLREIGTILNVSRSRVGQIEMVALRKILKQVSREKALSESDKEKAMRALSSVQPAFEKVTIKKDNTLQLLLT